MWLLWQGPKNFIGLVCKILDRSQNDFSVLYFVFLTHDQYIFLVWFVKFWTGPNDLEFSFSKLMPQVLNYGLDQNILDMGQKTKTHYIQVIFGPVQNYLDPNLF